MNTIHFAGEQMMNEQNMLEVRNLTKHFKVGSKQIVHAVDGVSFTLK